ncbi:hypothetical protein Tco_0542732 [Tanacetum coccineum]
MDAINYQEPIPEDFKCKCKLILDGTLHGLSQILVDVFLFAPTDIKLGSRSASSTIKLKTLHRLTSHEQLIILQHDFAGLQGEVAQTQKNASFWKSAFMILLTLVFAVYLMK